MAISMSSQKRRRTVHDINLNNSSNSNNNSSNQNPFSSQQQQTKTRNHNLQQQPPHFATTTSDDPNMMLLTTAATPYGGNPAMVRRIRSPHDHDVLSGRGGGINAHGGNVQFREWVRVRKHAYNLATTKAEKTRIAQEVIDLVRQQNPPGRFLQKDASAGGGASAAASVLGGWWMELDEDRVLAKTSQALREGAPQIRAAQGTPAVTASKAGRRVVTRKPAPVVTLATPPPVSSKGPVLTTPLGRTTPPRTAATRKRPLDHGEAPATTTAPSQPNLVEEEGVSHGAVSQVSSSSQIAVVESRSAPPSPKRVRVTYNGHTLRPADESPVLRSLDPSYHVPPPLDLSMLPASPPPVPKRMSVGRAHSLALGSSNDDDAQDKNDTGALDADWEFVNPFEDETFLYNKTNEATATISSSVQHPSEPPRRDSSESLGGSAPKPIPGVLHRETSTSSDMGGLGALLNDNGNNNNNTSSSNPAAGTIKRTSSISKQVNPGNRYASTGDNDTLLFLDPLLTLGSTADTRHGNGSSGSTAITREEQRDQHED